MAEGMASTDPQHVPAPKIVRTLTVPLPGAPHEHWVLMQAGWPMTNDQWEAMLHTLDKMKPGLVEGATDAF